MKRETYDQPIRIRRKSAAAPEWVKIETYPDLHERIRGVDIYQTKPPAELRYRVVISAYVGRAYRIPAVVAIANERRIRFGDVPMEFGILPPGERKVTQWFDELPDFKNRDVIISNPDFVQWKPDMTEQP